MPAYSFQERFIPMILDGSKDHTIRKDRAGRSRHAKPGNRLYLYYGMRTKYCRKIGEAICSHVEHIEIADNSISVYGDDYCFMLSPDACNEFAWSDGFRPDGSTIDHPDGAFDLMLRWWRQTHKLPFHGVVIYWKDFQPVTR